MSPHIALWDVDDAATYLRIPTSSVYKMTSRGTIPHTKIGGLVRFRKADLDAWIEAQTIAPQDRLKTARAKAQGAR